MTDSALPELYQFRYSMYPEKARWALDLKQIAHGRRSLLPGLHPPPLLKLAGQKCVPILRLPDGEIINSSTDIMRWADQVQLQPALFPAENAQRIEELVAEFDAVGPHVRRAFFQVLIPNTGYAADLFSHGCTESVQRRYRRGFPLIRLIMRADMKISRRAVEASTKQLAAALDRVVELSAATGYLVGDDFTAADLTAATVLQPCCLSDEFPVATPKPRPASVQAWLEQWADHPATSWVQRMYAEHRPPSVAAYDKGLKDD